MYFAKRARRFSFKMIFTAVYQRGSESLDSRSSAIYSAVIAESFGRYVRIKGERAGNLPMAAKRKNSSRCCVQTRTRALHTRGLPRFRNQRPPLRNNARDSAIHSSEYFLSSFARIYICFYPWRLCRTIFLNVHGEFQLLVQPFLENISDSISLSLSLSLIWKNSTVETSKVSPLLSGVPSASNNPRIESRETIREGMNLTSEARIRNKGKRKGASGSGLPRVRRILLPAFKVLLPSLSNRTLSYLNQTLLYKSCQHLRRLYLRKFPKIRS